MPREITPQCKFILVAMDYTAHIFRDILGKQALFSWWHGKGGLVDYSNEDAKNWWHGQMDNVLSLGIDGWKCDGTDPYILELVIPLGKKGLITRREYSDAYYADFFDYSRQKLGNDRLIMSRPVDGLEIVYKLLCVVNHHSG